jgi:hypothetical protein
VRTFLRSKHRSFEAESSHGAWPFNNQEPDMSKPDKDTHSLKQKRVASETTDAQSSDVTRPKRDARAWVTVNKLPGESKKVDARRNVPSGPLGGSGRKTNLSRSS